VSICQKLRKLEKELDIVRREGEPLTAAQLERLAIRIGRKRHPAAKVPMYFSTILTDLPPLSIPAHGGELQRATARCILDQLDDDVLHLHELCREDEAEEEDEE
jgi:hypothetical protein